MAAKRKRERLYRIEEIVAEHNLTRQQVVRRCSTRNIKRQQDPGVERTCLTMIAESDLAEILRQPAR